MLKLFVCLAALGPFGALAQSQSTGPTKAPPAELELIYMLVHGNVETQMPGGTTMKVKVSEGSAEKGVTGTIEISKIGHCRYEVSKDLVMQMSKEATLYYNDKATYDFSKPVTARIETAEAGAQVVTFDGPKGTVWLVKNLYFVREGIREPDANQTETEEDWELELKPSEGDVGAARYIAASNDFASRFCPGFQTLRQ